jgi:hypothetical protein
MANGLLSPVEQQTQAVFGMVPMEERLSILPRYSKNQGLIAPQFIYELAKAVSTPITAMRGQQVAPEESINAGFNAFMGGGLGTAPKGALRTFIGRNAKTWNPVAESKFLELEKAGVSPDQIWKQTGTVRGFDGKLRQEVSDKDAQAFFTHLQESGTTQLAPKALVNPAVEAAYPQFSNISQYGLREKLPGGFFEGTYTDGQFKGGLLMAKGPNVEGLKSAGLHEMQHGVQAIEGFSTGTSPSGIGKGEISSVVTKRAQKLRNEAMDLLDKDKIAEAKAKESLANKLIEEARMRAYLRNAGEAEARLTQRRMNLTEAERLANYPYSRGEYGLDINPKKIRK